MSSPKSIESLKNFGLVGTFFMGPLLHKWYQWLDCKYPGSSMRIVRKKLKMDVFLLAPPLYSGFYIVMSFLEGKPNMMEEWRKKFIPTYLAGLLFWIPAQYLNFKKLPPKYRVSFVAVCTFIELNIICILKRIQF